MIDGTIDDLELSPAMRAALVSLKRKTIRGICALRRCDVFDALDQNPTLREMEKHDEVAALESLLHLSGRTLVKEGRFESWDEVLRFVPAAAEALGVQFEVATAGRYKLPMLTLIFDEKTRVEVQGFVNFDGTKFEPVVPFRENLNAFAPDGSAGSEANAKARHVLRRAQELSAEAE